MYKDTMSMWHYKFNINNIIMLTVVIYAYIHIYSLFVYSNIFFV